MFYLDLESGRTSSHLGSAPAKGEEGYSRNKLNHLNMSIAQMVNREQRTVSDSPVPSILLKEPDLFYAVTWENEDDDDESLALSFRAQNMLESDEMKDLYVSGQKKLLQYDYETVKELRRQVNDVYKSKFDGGSNSEVELAISITVAEALAESIRQDENSKSNHAPTAYSTPIVAVQN